MTRRPKKKQACDGKRAYPSREAAMLALKAVARKAGSNYGQLQVYRCRWDCRVGSTPQRAWHFGHRVGSSK